MVGYRPFLNAGRFPAALWQYGVLSTVDYAAALKQEPASVSRVILRRGLVLRLERLDGTFQKVIYT
jgi:hypothetical protein